MKYLTGTIEIDSAHFTVTQAGKAVPVEPKVFDVIVYLIIHRDSVVSRDELFRQIWGGREVSDTTLSNHIKSARKLLGDNGESQQVIKTIRGRGYQFIAPIETLFDQSSTSRLLPSSSDALTGQTHSFTYNFRYLAIGLCVLLLVLLLILNFDVQHTASQPDNPPLVLVLPFGTSSADNEKWQPFADQMTKEIIRKLEHISALRVIPAASAFSFRHGEPHQQIKQTLPKVRYVINAMVNVSTDSNIRVTANMTDLSFNQRLWDKDFESRIDNNNFFLFKIMLPTLFQPRWKLLLG